MLGLFKGQVIFDLFEQMSASQGLSCLRLMELYRTTYCRQIFSV